MRPVVTAVLTMFLAIATQAQQPATDQQPHRANLSIDLEPLGDGDDGVVARITFRFAVPSDVPADIPLAIQGSILRGTEVVRNFRFVLRPDERETLRTIQTLPATDVSIEARLMIPLEEQAPVIIDKTTKTFSVAATGKPYEATAEEGAEGAYAEGMVPESAGTVRIRPPRRDVAPNLFVVDVDVKPPVTRVEFWVEDKKIMARTAPPYRAELDLGKLPKRVEVRVIGYDTRGRYVDADAFVVNERETPLEVKITRTDSPDGTTHFKLSVQNPKNTAIRSVVLYAGQKKLYQWDRPPYALNIPTARLQGIEFVRASVIDETNYEAADLLFLSGRRHIEEIEVNLVELPISVTDSAGVPVTDLKQESFTIFENGKPQRISSFHFASNLPISVGVLLDHSGSMEKRIKDAREAAIQFFRNIIRPADRAFFAGFAFDSRNIAPFVSDISLIEAQVTNSPEAAGGTALYDAIITGLYRFRSVQGRKALIIITDGEDTSSRLAYEDMLTYARAARVPLYFIGIGLGFADISGTSKMKGLATETGGVVYLIKDVKLLEEAYRRLESDLRSQYLVSYHTESSRKDQKYRTVEVKVDRADARVRTIRGFIP